MSRASSMTNPISPPWTTTEAALSFNERFSALLTGHIGAIGDLTRPTYFNAGNVGIWTAQDDTNIYVNYWDGLHDVLLWTVVKASGTVEINNPEATEDVFGVVIRASDIEAATGLDESKYITPKHLGDAVRRLEENISSLLTAGGGVRNLILSAKKDTEGQPAFLAMQTFYDMRHENTAYGATAGFAGTVSASSIFDSTWPANSPVVNQLASVNNSGWRSAAADTAPTWTYTLNVPQVFTSVYINFYAPNYNPSHFYLQAQETDGGPWDRLYETDFRSYNGDDVKRVEKQYGTMFYFLDNTKAYKTYQFVFTPNASSTIIIRSLRFYTPAIEGMDAFDVALLASTDDPFKASIAQGTSGDNIITVERNIILDATTFYEMSRNYIYVVPENPDTSCPDYVDAARAQHIPEAHVWIVPDVRKVQYDGPDGLKKQIKFLYQGHETIGRVINNDTMQLIGHMTDGWKQPMLAIGADIVTSPADQYRGASNSVQISKSYPNGWLGWNIDRRDPLRIVPDAKSQLQGRDFTIEFDFKYAGLLPNDPSVPDNYGVLFDGGYQDAGSWSLLHHYRRGQFSIALGTVGTQFTAPYAFDNEWHTFSLSYTNGYVFMHVDGVCLVALDAFVTLQPSVFQYTLFGRFLAGSNAWNGSFTNLRINAGNCIRQSNNYTVPTVFKESYILDKTLWYDRDAGIVKQWSEDTMSWSDTPMLCIGHIDAGHQKNLVSDQPFGTWLATQNIMTVANITASGQVNASYNATGVLDMATVYPWTTPTNANTTDHWVQIELPTAASFSELRLLHHGGNQPIWNMPVLFRWSGSNNGTDWTVLIDRAAPVWDGNYNGGIQHYLGRVPNWLGYKRLPYDNTTAFKYYRMDLPAKGALPFYNTNSTTVSLACMYRGAKIEPVTVTPYVIGDINTISQYANNAAATVYTIPAPFGGAPYTVEGWLEDRLANGGGRRRINEFSIYGSFTSGGEVMVYYDNSFNITVGNSTSSPFSGTAGNYGDNNGGGAAYGNYTFICKRLY